MKDSPAVEIPTFESRTAISKDKDIMTWFARCKINDDGVRFRRESDRKSPFKKFEVLSTADVTSQGFGLCYHEVMNI